MTSSLSPEGNTSLNVTRSLIFPEKTYILESSIHPMQLKEPTSRTRLAELFSYLADKLVEGTEYNKSYDLGYQAGKRHASLTTARAVSAEEKAQTLDDTALISPVIIAGDQQYPLVSEIVNVPSEAREDPAPLNEEYIKGYRSGLEEAMADVIAGKMYDWLAEYGLKVVALDYEPEPVSQPEELGVHTEPVVALAENHVHVHYDAGYRSADEVALALRNGLITPELAGAILSDLQQRARFTYQSRSRQIRPGMYSGNFKTTRGGDILVEREAEPEPIVSLTGDSLILDELLEETSGPELDTVLDVLGIKPEDSSDSHSVTLAWDSSGRVKLQQPVAPRAIDLMIVAPLEAEKLTPEEVIQITLDRIAGKS